MSINGVNNLNLYGTDKSQSSSASASQTGANGKNDSIFAALIGMNQSGLDITQMSSLMQSIDINGDGKVAKDEMKSFLANPTAIIAKATAANQQPQNASILQNLLPLLFQLIMGGNKLDKADPSKASQTPKSSTPSSSKSQTDTQLKSALDKIDQLMKKIETQNDPKVSNAKSAKLIEKAKEKETQASALDNEVKGLETKLEQDKAKVTVLKTEIEDAKTKIDGAKAKVDADTAKNKEANDKLNTKTQEKNAKTEEKSSHETKATELTNKASEARASETSLRDQANGVEIPALSQETDEDGNVVSDNSADISAAEAQRDELNSKADAEAQKAADLENQAKAETEAAQKLTQEIETLGKDIDGLNQEIKATSDEITNLQAEIFNNDKIKADKESESDKTNVDISKETEDIADKKARSEELKADAKELRDAAGETTEDPKKVAE